MHCYSVAGEGSGNNGAFCWLYKHSSFTLVPSIIPYSGKLLRVQTFANMLSEAPEEFFTVLIFVTKQCLAQYHMGC